MIREVLMQHAERIAAKNYPENGDISREDWVDLFVGLMVESDRGCVLISSTVIDQALKRLLSEFFLSRSKNCGKDVSFFMNEKSATAPLNSTALKIRLAFMLGLLDETHKEVLTAIQRLRSRVAAHGRQVMTLDDADIDQIITGLPNPSDPPRHRFIAVVSMELAAIERARALIE